MVDSGEWSQHTGRGCRALETDRLAGALAPGGRQGFPRQNSGRGSAPRPHQGHSPIALELIAVGLALVN